MRKLAVRSSGINGLGVFALRSISFGEKVLILRRKEEWIWNIPRDKWKFCYRVDYDRYILPTDLFPSTLNTVVTSKRALAAFREISKGEEITFDYSTNVGWDGFEVE